MRLGAGKLELVDERLSGEGLMALAMGNGEWGRARWRAGNKPSLSADSHLVSAVLNARSH